MSAYVGGSTAWESRRGVELALRNLLEDGEEAGEESPGEVRIGLGSAVTAGEDARTLLHHARHVWHHSNHPRLQRQSLKFAQTQKNNDLRSLFVMLMMTAN